MKQTATPPKRNNKRVIIGAALFLLAIVWGFGIYRLDKQTLIQASPLWYTALSVGLITTVLITTYMALNSQKNRASAQWKWWFRMTAVIYLYCTVAFGTLAVFLMLWLNSALVDSPVQEIKLPVDDWNAYKVRRREQVYVNVTFEGQSQRIFVDRKSLAMGAKSIVLTLQKGRFGYWVIRDKSTSVFP